MSRAKRPRVLTLQSYYGGSHRQFIDQWISHSRLDWDMMTLPDRHWKWRMRHSAVEFARHVDAQWDKQCWDAIFCTDMLNLAEFKGLITSPARELPFIVYFHENQFEYPNCSAQPRDMHFAFTNLTTALAADFVWFNSQFNLDSMLKQLKKWLGIWPDYQPESSLELIQKKSTVLCPGVAITDNQESAPHERRTSIVHIVWAARWEHDKNPDGLLDILECLDGQIDFRLSVIGQQFAHHPGVFDKIKQRFGKKILHWGYQEDRLGYEQILRDADVFLSTAEHEFFGIAAVESMALGCLPILPNRLSYPELLAVSEFPQRAQFLYESTEDAVSKIVRIAAGSVKQASLLELTNHVSQRFGWERCADALDSGIESILLRHDTNAYSRSAHQDRSPQ